MSKDFERKSLFKDELKSEKGGGPPPSSGGRAGKADSLDDLLGGGDDVPASKKGTGGRLNIKTW